MCGNARFPDFITMQWPISQGSGFFVCMELALCAGSGKLTEGWADFTLKSRNLI